MPVVTPRLRGVRRNREQQERSNGNPAVFHFGPPEFTRRAWHARSCPSCITCSFALQLPGAETCRGPATDRGCTTRLRNGKCCRGDRQAVRDMIYACQGGSHVAKTGEEKAGDGGQSTIGGDPAGAPERC